MSGFHCSAQPKYSRFVFLALSCALLGVAAFGASADWQKTDPSKWTDDDVYQILNNSPWSRPSKIKVSSNDSGSFGDQGPGAGGTGNSGGQTPIGTGRRGGGVGRSNRAGTPPPPPGASNSNPSQVTVQWQSALPVRLAAAKKSGAPIDSASDKPLDEYVIAVIGLPMRYIGGHSASLDSGPTNDSDEERRLADRLKTASSLRRPGHDPLAPAKVELNQGVDGRILFYFPKADPITAQDKSIEFRIAMGSMELKKKFILKEMEYQDKLDL